MTDCQHCGAKSQLYLCTTHVKEFHEILIDLPRLAHHLAETATGQTKLGERTRRIKSDEAPMRVNLRASEQLRTINLALIGLVQKVCRSLDTSYRAPTIVGPVSHHQLHPGEISSEYHNDTAKLAFWLANHVEAIAGLETAGTSFASFNNHINRIVATINRPVPPRFCGPCPTIKDESTRSQCGTALMAKREAEEVRCPNCKALWNVDYLMHRLLAEVDHWRFTCNEVLLIMSTLGDELSKRTFQHWRQHKIVTPRGYRRLDGRIALTKHNDDDEPVYRLSDVRNARGKSAIPAARHADK